MLKPAHTSLLEVQDLVRRDFVWSEKDDLESATTLELEFSKPEPFGVQDWENTNFLSNIMSLKDKLTHASKVLFVGAAATAQEVSNAITQDCVVIAADGAAGAVQDFSKLGAIVSDFDGEEHLDHAASLGHLIIGHAHGDNLSLWRQKLETWSKFENPPKLILTHQTNSEFDFIVNPGGFTDGDRALAFVLSLGISKQKFEFVGYSMTPSSNWSSMKNPSRKARKLTWMKEVFRLCGLENEIDV